MSGTKHTGGNWSCRDGNH